jgi:uncharacterized protein YukE
MDDTIEIYGNRKDTKEINVVLDKIRTEIEQIADEEQKHDEKWARGLRYALKIIDKYKSEDKNG